MYKFIGCGTAVLSAVLCWQQPASAFQQPDTRQMLSYVEATARANPPFSGALAGIPPDGPSDKFAEKLWKKLRDRAEFNDDTTAWLKKRTALNAEELVRKWIWRYHRTYGAAVWLLDDQDVVKLYRLAEPIQLIDRGGCRSAKDVEELNVLITNALNKISDADLDDLADKMADAYVRTLKRAGPTELEKAAGPRSVTAFRAAVAQWPAADRPKIEAKFSYGVAASSDWRENCERDWLGAHVMSDATSADNSLLRHGSLSALFGTVWRDADEQSENIAIPDFTAGEARLAYPPLASSARLEGQTTIRLTIDERGMVSDLRILSSKYNQASVKSIDGSAYTPDELFRPAMVNFFRDGIFSVKQADGRNVPYSKDLVMVWKLP